MEKVAIKTNEKFFFKGAVKGFIEMKIKLAQLQFEEGQWELILIDTCYDFEEIRVLREGTGENPQYDIITVRKDLAFEIREGKKFSFTEIDKIAKVSGLNRANFNTEMDFIKEVFRKGLLYTTQEECNRGILEPGKGMYNTPAYVWEIVKD